MARVAEHASLDILLGTIRQLEARLLELKTTANEVATGEGLVLPFPAADSLGSEAPFIWDLVEGEAADRQG